MRVHDLLTDLPCRLLKCHSWVQPSQEGATDFWIGLQIPTTSAEFIVVISLVQGTGQPASTWFGCFMNPFKTLGQPA